MYDSLGKDDTVFIFATPLKRELDFWYVSITRMYVLDAEIYISLRICTLL